MFISKKSQSQQGFTLIELVVSMAIVAILSAIALPTLMRIVGDFRVNAAIAELRLATRVSRYDAMTGTKPRTMCVGNSETGLKYLSIEGRDCDEVKSWTEIKSVRVDLEQSTLRSVNGVAGNSTQSDRIYRLSYGNTRGGYGGSYGQLGKLVVTHPWTPNRMYRALLWV
ncbi:MAG: type II secretion system protein [Roseofilum sp. SID3]|uniref:type II secretion system protein n=1 Tax=Roseofilum sp. SID3 TaxID=2821499 RepID=UPI001B227F24|nr:type II secretion system protein [Roseofilum sp. SID3]MBP0015333.1 type II secretion system protein [Roseofilum sp. SID3]